MVERHIDIVKAGGSFPPSRTMFTIESVLTKDGIKLAGIVAYPKKGGKTAVIWVHGFTSKFYSGNTRNQELAKSCLKQGSAFASFNNRGQDVAVHFYKTDDAVVFGGAGFEKFTDCIYDIDAYVKFFLVKGYKEIVLIGHSTGANKVAYYLSQKPHKAVRGGVLAAPISDIAGTRNQLGAKKFDALVASVKKQAQGKSGDTIVRVPVDPGILTYDRFLSMYTPGMPEDMFPYYSDKPWPLFRKITKPLLVAIGEKDQWLDRPLKEYLVGFANNANSKTKLATAVIKNSDHSYVGAEKSFAKIVTQWIQKI